MGRSFQYGWLDCRSPLPKLKSKLQNLSTTHAPPPGQPRYPRPSGLPRHGHVPRRAGDRLRLRDLPPSHPKNRRTRSSVVLGLPEGNLLVDSPPDLRLQLLREDIGLVHAVLYTHEHADHLFGLDDLRIFADYLKHDLPVYCDEHVEERIRRTFDYAFDPAARQYPAGGVPRLASCRSPPSLRGLGRRVTPIPLGHGRLPLPGLPFRQRGLLHRHQPHPPGEHGTLAGLDVLVLDALRRRPHPTHFSLDEAIQARQLPPKRTLFTHICHDLEHEATNAALPPGWSWPTTGWKCRWGC